MSYRVRSFALLFLSALGGLSKATEPESFRSAGCVVSSGGNILLVRDIWSRKWQLPGGGCEIDKGETAQECAERETLEETGIQISALHPLKVFKKFRVFYCLPKNREPIAVLKSTGGKRGEFRIQPPIEAKNEIDDARFFSTPESLLNLKLRFPNQREFLTQPHFWSHLPEPTIALGTPIKNSNLKILFWSFDPSYFEEELKVISSIRAFLGESFVVKFILNLFNFLGEEKLYFALLPLVWIVYGKKLGFEFALLIVLGAIFNGLLKDFFEMPRPRDFDPSLDQKSSNGFGFPSGHVQIATTSFLFIFWRLVGSRHPSRNIVKILVPIFAAFGVALGRIYFGAHFILDVVGGFLWAFIAFPIFLKLGQAFSQSYFSNSYQQNRFIFGLWVFCGAALTALYKPHPDTYIPNCFMIGLLGGILLITSKIKMNPKVLNAKQVMIYWLGFVGIFFLIPVLFKALINLTHGNAIGIIVLKGVEYLLLGFILSFTQGFQFTSKFADDPSRLR